MLKCPIVLSEKNYLLAVIIIAPLLNFLFGISVDLYAPSIYNITQHFHVSEFIGKRTIGALFFGFCLGCIVLGPLMDDYGRRKVIALSLLGFACISLLALIATDIHELTLIRVFQGVLVAAASIGSRILIFDNFTGKRYAIAILYTSFAYSLGPVIAPFLGGWLQYLYGWQSVFVAYSALSLILFLFVFLFIKDNPYQQKKFSLKKVAEEYWTITKNKIFFSGAIILGLSLFELMSFSVLGSYYFNVKLHLTSVNFGDSALLMGLSYLGGTLINRFLIPITSQKKLCTFGLIVLFLSSISYLLMSLILPFSEMTLVLPNMLISFSAGFIFPNILGAILKLYPKNIGVASATQSLLFMAVSMLTMFIVDHLNMHLTMHLGFLYLTLAVIQCIMFFKYFVHIYNKDILVS